MPADNKSKYKLFAIFSILAFFVFFSNYQPRPVFAGTSDNVSGWAWSSNVGWISFNSVDCDKDGDGAYEGAAETGGPAPAGCPTSGTVVNYGVKIDLATGNFSGYAWSSNVGWISFNRSICVAGVNAGKYCLANSDCPGSTCSELASGAAGDPPVTIPASDPGGGSGPIARINVGTGAVSGWAKILSMRDNGWIRLNHSQPNPVTHNIATNEFGGWAYNEGAAGTGIGWISFNDDQCDVDDNDRLDIACGGNNITTFIADYAVIASLNQSPVISGMTAPNITTAMACTGSALRAKLDWTFNDADSGDKMQSYRLVVYKGLAEIFNSGICTNVANASCSNCTGWNSGDTCSFTLNSSHGLEYSTNYRWSIEVWDNKGGTSGATQYNNNTIGDTDGNPDNNPLTFTTYASKFPDPDLTYFPLPFSVGEEVLFDARNSQYGNSPSFCGESDCSFSWSDPDNTGNITFSPNNAATSTIIFDNPSASKIRLTVTEGGYSCFEDSTFSIKYRMPTWTETKR